MHFFSFALPFKYHVHYAGTRRCSISRKDRHTRPRLAYETTLRRKVFRCSKVEKNLTASTGLDECAASPHPPFTPKGYGWRGSWVTCILRAAFISIRQGFDPRPNLICVPSREQTLFESERRAGRPKVTLPSISLLSSYFYRNPSLTQGIRDTVVTSYAYTSCIANAGRSL